MLQLLIDCYQCFIGLEGFVKKIKASFHYRPKYFLSIVVIECIGMEIGGSVVPVWNADCPCAPP